MGEAREPFGLIARSLPSARKARERRRAIIIGGGASGTLLARHLFERDAGLHVTIIEPRPQVGHGIAYSTGNPDHLLNVRAENMSAFPDRPGHFWQWLSERTPALRAAGRLVADCADPFCFVPRHIYGDYLAELIEPFLAGPGARLQVIEDEAVSIDEGPGGVTVTVASGGHHTADIAVLATGHEVQAADGEWRADPWGKPSSTRLPADAPVLILGTGLTMVDHALTLLASSHRGPIIAMSRRGLLPWGHRRCAPYAIKAAEVPVGAPCSELLRWIRGHVERHAASGGDWRSVIDGLRPFTQTLWQGLSPADRRRFLEHGRAWWDVHRHRMAPEVEGRIKQALTSGQLRVIAARLVDIDPADSGAIVRYRHRGARRTKAIHVVKVVDCRIAPAIPPRAVNPVLCDLFDRGMARADALGLGVDVTTDCALVNRGGVASQRIFAAGPLTRAAFWEIVAIPDIRTQCARLAAHIERRLAARVAVS